jgi:hypothetical protein
MTDQELKDLFESDADALSQAVHVPAAGQIWWRSAIRARAESAHAATRPMVWLQALTGAGAVGLACGGLTMVWPRLQEIVAQATPSMGSSMLAALPPAMLLAIGAGVLAAPIAYYLAVPRD